MAIRSLAMRRAARASHGQESAGVRPRRRRHRQRAARAQVERLDPEDLDARQHASVAASIPVRRAGATRFRRRPDRARSAYAPASRCSADGGTPSATSARCSRSSHARLRLDRLPPATRSCSGCTTRWQCTSCRCFARSASSAGTCRDTSPSSPRYMSAQITRFCAMFISHVTPTHWSRRIASACSDNVEAFFHSPASTRSCRRPEAHSAIACGCPTACASAFDCSDECSAQCSAVSDTAPWRPTRSPSPRAMRNGSPASSAMSR